MIFSELAPFIEELSKRHVRYGVKEEHYQTMKIAIGWAMNNAYKNVLSPELIQYWLKAFGILSDMMIEISKKYEAEEAEKKENNLQTENNTENNPSLA